jgi:ABC-2 type transport system permease protein
MKICAWNLKDDWGWLLGCTVLIGIVICFLVSLYPSYSQMVGDLFLNLPIAKSFMGPFAGELISRSLVDAFFTLEFFSWFGLMLSLYPLMDAGSAIAGELEHRTLDVLLAQPISRSCVLLEKFLAIAIHMAVICLASFLILWAALAVWVSASPSIREYALVFISLYGLLLVITAFGFLCSVLLPSTQMVVAVGFGSVLLSFIFHKGLSAFEQTQWLARLTPFYYADPTKILLRGTLDWADSLVLFGTGGTLLMLSLILFERKDITVS